MIELKQSRVRRFTHVSRTVGSVYIAGMSNGMVKVGFSNNPRTRLDKLNTASKKLFGCRIVDFHVYDGIGALRQIQAPYNSDSSRGRAFETICIRRLAQVGKACAPTVEYFEGIGFAAAKSLIDAEIARLAA